jgi:gas vesicle protein
MGTSIGVGGGVIGLLIGVIVACLVCVCCRKRKEAKMRKMQAKDSPSYKDSAKYNEGENKLQKKSKMKIPSSPRFGDDP